MSKTVVLFGLVCMGMLCAVVSKSTSTSSSASSSTGQSTESSNFFSSTRPSTGTTVGFWSCCRSVPQLVRPASHMACRPPPIRRSTPSYGSRSSWSTPSYSPTSSSGSTSTVSTTPGSTPTVSTTPGSTPTGSTTPGSTPTGSTPTPRSTPSRARGMPTPMDPARNWHCIVECEYKHENLITDRNETDLNAVKTAMDALGDKYPAWASTLTAAFNNCTAKPVTAPRNAPCKSGAAYLNSCLLRSMHLNCPISARSNNTQCAARFSNGQG